MSSRAQPSCYGGAARSALSVFSLFFSLSLCSVTVYSDRQTDRFREKISCNSRYFIGPSHASGEERKGGKKKKGHVRGREAGGKKEKERET